ncbi:MAG: hypothetical protein ACK55Z_03745, partial [bacterium]
VYTTQTLSLRWRDFVFVFAELCQDQLSNKFPIYTCLGFIRTAPTTRKVFEHQGKHTAKYAARCDLCLTQITHQRCLRIVLGLGAQVTSHVPWVRAIHTI